MTVVDAEASVRETLTRLHPLIRIVLKHDSRIDEAVGRAILESVEESICRQIGRELDLDSASIDISAHTRLRELMSDSRLVRGVSAETSAGEDTPGGTEAAASTATPTQASALREEVDAAIEARTQAVSELLGSADELNASFIRLYVGEGLSDVEIARRLDISSEHIARLREDLLTKLENVWLGMNPSEAPSDKVPSCFDPSWSYHFVPYVRGKLDPDRTNYIEGHAFRCLRCGARLGGLQAVIDRIRSGEWAPSAGGKARPAQSAGLKVLGIAAVIVVGLLSVFLVRSSIVFDGVHSALSEVSVFQPVEIPAGLSLPEGSPYAATLSEALEAYNRKGYAESADGWQRLYDAGVRVSNLTLYLGVSQLLASRAEDAAVTLARQVPSGTEGTPYHFYRAQSLLVLGRVEEAREELRGVLAAGESPYREQAETQLTALLGHPGN